MARRKLKPALAVALRAAGVCAIHSNPRPCGPCDLVFRRAEKQRRERECEETRRLHAEYLARAKVAA
jgi:hypothetical protein